MCTQANVGRPSIPVCEEYPDAQSDCLAVQQRGAGGRIKRAYLYALEAILSLTDTSTAC